jgi:hypothetical protein
MIDITGPFTVQIQIRGDGKVVWVNTENGCVLRLCNIQLLEIIDEREAFRDVIVKGGKGGR